MEEQKSRARAAWSGSGEKATEEIWFELYQKHGATEFLGYEVNEAQAIILAIIDNADGKIIVTNQTPFYGESGGQMGDIGYIISSTGEKYKVNDTKKFLGKIHAHYVENCNFKESDNVIMKIDTNYRNNLRIHHSATHLLHITLRKVLGEHLTQKGSLVAHDRFRFDFSHNKALSLEEIVEVEKLVNSLIRENSLVNVKLMSTEDAISSGAMALFGEKYEEEVRVISMGPSTELCGGTHVNRSGDIGLIKIVSENAIAAGIRRIEAICGSFALDYLNSQENLLNRLAQELKSPKSNLLDKVSSLLRERKELEDSLTNLRKEMLINSSDISIVNYGDIELVEKFAENIEVKDLRNFVEHMRSKHKNAIIVAGSSLEGKSSLIIAVGDDLVDRFDAASLIRQANACADGQGGGGRRELAQAGGFNYQKRKEISNLLNNLLCLG